MRGRCTQALRCEGALLPSRLPRCRAPPRPRPLVARRMGVGRKRCPAAGQAGSAVVCKAGGRGRRCVTDRTGSNWITQGQRRASKTGVPQATGAAPGTPMKSGAVAGNPLTAGGKDSKVIHRVHEGLQRGQTGAGGHCALSYSPAVLGQPPGSGPREPGGGGLAVAARPPPVLMTSPARQPMAVGPLVSVPPSTN